MKRLFITSALLLGASSLFLGSAQELTRVPVFEMNTEGSRFYRIPALGVANDGTLLAVADKRGDALGDLPNTISVVLRRSVDNGDTWSDMLTLAQGDKATGKTYGDPVIVVDRESGTILVLFVGDYGFWDSRNTPSKRSGLYYVKSTDNGATWTEPVRFDSQVYKNNWQGGFIASGSALQLRSGRIMCVVNAHTSTSPGNNQEQFAIWTDDLGETWHTGSTSATPRGNGNESKLVELENGDILMSIRGGGKRMYAISSDGGDTWRENGRWSDMISADCNGDIVRYSWNDSDKSRILHSVPSSSIRENVTVFLSYDEAKTWPVSKTIYPGYSAYSSMAVLPDGQIGCLVEEGKWDSNLPGEDGFNLAFYRFPLEWFTEGRDTPGAGIDAIETDGTTNGTNVDQFNSTTLTDSALLYNLQGIRVDRETAPSGLYILRTPEHQTKLLLP